VYTAQQQADTFSGVFFILSFFNKKALKLKNVKIIIIIIIIIIRKIRKNLEAIPGKRSIDSLQKAAMLGTSHT
jgi:hypothetical protein